MSLFRVDIARTLGDLVLAQLYAQGGSTGTVRMNARRAAQALRGDEPSEAEVRVVRDMLYALVENSPRNFVVKREPDSAGSFVIERRIPKHTQRL